MPEKYGSLGWLDWTVIAAYFVGITLYGLWIARKTHTSEAYFLGSRKLPWWIMLAQSFSTGTHAEGPVLQAGATYAYGFAAIWYQWKNMLITPFYWLIAPWYRRSRRTTVAEIIDDRYGRTLGLIYTIFAITFFIFIQGVMLKGAGKAVAGATGGMVSANGVVLVMTVVFVLYSFVGGLVATAYTNLVQGFLIIALSFMLLPAGLMAVGGFAGMRTSLPADFFELYNQRSGIDGFTILMLAINGLVGIVAQPHMVSMCATGRSERGGRIGMTYGGGIVKRLCAIGWALTGVIVAGMTVNLGISLKDPEEAFGYACLNCLGPGLVGLMVAAIVAANMSACSNFMVNTGALFTKNLYCTYLRPMAGDREILRVGRCSGLLLTLLGVWFALGMGNVLSAFMFTETTAALMGIMFMGGLLWKRANRYGAATSIVVAFAVYYLLNFLMTCPLPDGPSKDLWPVVQHSYACWQDGTLGQLFGTGTLQLVANWKGGPFGCTLLAGFIALIVVSLITKPEPVERITQFFEKMRHTSDDTTSLEIESKVLAADRGEDLLLLDFPGWLTIERWQGFFRRYREDIVGFALAWGSVAVLVLIAWGLMQIGK
jgi:Na+/proline symporter